MAKMIMMCGIPGSGKSSYAERLAKEDNYIIHASDKIREEFGDVNDQSKNEEVFRILHKRIKTDLLNGYNIIYDSTALSRKRRVAFLRELKNIPCEKICVLMATPWEYCLAYNFARDRQVPVEVMCNMLKRFQIPSIKEGFDRVIIHYENEEWKEFYGDVEEYVKSLRDFKQDNSHHKMTLGDHMIATGNYMLIFNGNKKDDIYYAALTHDIGKPDVKSYMNHKKEIGTEAHYYNHNNLGCYRSLFYRYPEDINKEYVALMIENHMKPYVEWKQSDKVRIRDVNMFGEQFCKDILMLHLADDWAH